MKTLEFYRHLLVYALCASMVLQGPGLIWAQSGAPILADGRTQTQISTQGAITDIRTGTIHGNNAYNSFSRFNVPGGTTTNLHVPDQAGNLVNLVHNERSQIDGILNSYKNGQIGGNVYFLNPHGIVIGQGGAVNVGSLTMMTPSQQFMDDLISKGGYISAVHEQQLFEGKVPLSESGLISVKGKVRALDHISVFANGVNVDSGATMRAGRTVQVDFADLVNAGGVQSGNELLLDSDGKIRIVAAENVDISGQIAVDADRNEKAGSVEIRSGADIEVHSGAQITARGIGTDSDGGEITIFADRNATLHQDALISAAAETGKGGFLEFSAVDTVTIFGNGLENSFGGTILIDPDHINWTGSGNDKFTGGADYILEAGKSITLNDVLISTRQVSGTDREAHKSGLSTGSSGNLVLDAPVITLKNSWLLTHATGYYDAGGIGIFGYNTEGLQNTAGHDAYPDQNWENLTINASAVNGRAGDIVLSAISEQWTIKNSVIKNDALSSNDRGRLFIGDYDRDAFREGHAAELSKLKDGGTLTLDNVDIDTGYLYILAGHPGGSDMTNLVEGIITLSNGTDIKADRVKMISEEDIHIHGSTILTNKTHQRVSETSEPDVYIAVIRNDKANLADIGVKRTSTIEIDKDSSIEGNDIFVQVLVTAGTYMELNEAGKIINEDGDEITQEELSLYDTINQTVVDIFEETIPKLLSDFEMPLVASFRGLDVSANITINGTLTAENSIDIVSTAAASSTAFNLGVAGFAFNVGVTITESNIVLGSHSNLTAINGDISIESVIENTVTQTTFNAIPVNAVPLDVVLGIGVLLGDNKIDVQRGAKLTAEQGYIDIEARSERTASISATGGRGNSTLAFTMTLLVEDFDTRVLIGGELTAKGADILAYTEVHDNAQVTKTMMGDGWMGGGIATFDAATNLITNIKSGVFSVLTKITGKTFGNDEAREFGFGTALAIMVDQVDTDAIITGTAKIRMSDYLNLDAKTKNVPVAVASAVTNKFKLNSTDKELTGKDGAFEISLPLIVLLQETNAEVQNGAELYVGRDDTEVPEGKDPLPSGITIRSITEVPYNTKLWIADLIGSALGERESPEIMDVITQILLNNNLGLDSGLFNTWSQTSVDAESLAVGVMLSVMYMQNDTLAKIHDGVTVAGYGGETPDLSVIAVTDTQLGHVTGNMRSFLKQMPNVTYPNVGKASGAGGKSSATFRSMFQSMWGNQGDKGVGAGIGFNMVNNEARAEIGAADLTVNDLNVSAKTTGIDVSISLGASKTDDFGLNGTMGVTVFTTDVYAKIDDSAIVNATNNVNIKADDDTVVVGVGGNLVVSDATAFGVTAIVPVVVRNLHAVWGNYIEEGPEAIAENVLKSTVGNTVTVRADALGITATLALAGAVTDSSQSGQTQESQEMEKQLQDMLAMFNNGADRFKGDPESEDAIRYKDRIAETKAELQKIQQGKTTGASNSSTLAVSGSIVVNLLIEEVYAGISGNVDITAGKFQIEAVNKAVIGAVSGAGVLQLGSDGTNRGIAGGIGVNMLFGDTHAFVKLAPTGKLTYGDEFSLKADRGGYIGALTAGAAGSTSSKGFEVAGSLSVAAVTSETIATILGSTVTNNDNGKGNIVIDAQNEAVIVNLAGGVAVGGKVAAGISLAASAVSLDTRTSILDSTIHAHNMTNKARTESLIITVALGAGIAYSGSVGVGGTLAFVLSDGDTSVQVHGSTLDLSGNLNLAALSDTITGTDDMYESIIAAIQQEESEGEGGEGDKSTFLEDGLVFEFNETEAVENEDGEYERRDSLQTQEVQLGLSGRNPRIVTAAVAIGVSKTVGVGANIGVNLMTEQTVVSVTNSTISAYAADIKAETAGSVFAAGVGVAGAGKVGVAGNFGVNLVGGRTEIVFDNTSGALNKLTATSGDIVLSAQNRSGIINASVVVGGGGTAGVGVGFSYNMLAHSTAVSIEDWTFDAQRGKIDIDAENASDLISVLLTVGGGGTAGVAASISLNTIGTIQLDDVDMDTPEDIRKDADDKQDELAEIFDFLDGNPLELIGQARNRTRIDIVDSVLTAENDVKMGASSTGGMITISIGAGFGGTAGVGVAAGYNSISGAVGVFGDEAEITSESGNVLVHSQIANDMYSFVIGGGFGGTAGVGVSVAGNVMLASNQVDFRNTSSLDAAEDIVLKATNSGQIVGSSTSFAGGRYVGVSTAFLLNLLRGTTSVDLRDTTLDSEASIILDAETDSEIYGVAATAAFSFITDPSSLVTASIGAAIAVNEMKSSTRIGVVDSVLDAKGNIVVHTHTDNRLLAVSGNLALAISLGAAVAASTTYNGVHGTSEIVLTGTVIDASADTNESFEELARAYTLSGVSSSFSGNKGVGISATAKNNLDNFFFSVAVSGAAGIAVGVPVNHITTKTNITLDNVKINTLDQDNAKDLQDVIILAASRNESFGAVASIAGGIVGIGAIANIHIMDSDVQTHVKNSTLNAKRDILIDAFNRDELESHQVGVAVGAALGAPINAMGTIESSKVKTILDGAKLDAGNDLSVLARNELDLFELAVSIGGGAVGAGIAFAVNDLEQETSVLIKGKTDLQSRNQLSVQALGNAEFRQHVHALGAGIGGLGGAMGFLDYKSSAKVVFQETGSSPLRLTSTAGDIDVLAQDVFKQNESVVGGYAIGLVGAAGGLSLMDLQNSAQVSGKANMTADAGKISAAAKVDRTVNQATIAAAASLSVGLAGTINSVDIGSSGSRDGFADTLDALSDLDSESGSDSRRADSALEMFTSNYAAVKNGSIIDSGAALVLEGNFSAKNIDLQSYAKNNLTTNTYGIGVGGLFAAGGALELVNVQDSVLATYRGEASAESFLLKGHSLNSGSFSAVAGGGSLFIAAAGGDSQITFENDILTLLDKDGIINAGEVSLEAEQVYSDITTQTDGGSVGGLLGLGGALADVELLGNAIVRVGENAKVYSPDINVSAKKIYDKIQMNVFGLAGGLIGGGGVDGTLTLRGDAAIDIRDGVTFWNHETRRPQIFNDKINLTALVEVKNNTRAVGNIDSGGLAATPFGTTQLQMDFATSIDFGKVDFKSAVISANAYQQLNASSLHTTIAAGGVGAAGGVSALGYGASNRIAAQGSKFYAWESLDFNAGKGTTVLDAQNRVFNYTLIPITTDSMTEAVTAVNVKNAIELTGSSIYTVEDIELNTGRENFTLVAYDKTVNTYESKDGMDFEIEGDFSRVTSSGIVKKAHDNQVIFGANNELVAGYHHEAFITIDENDNLTHSDWMDSVQYERDSLSIYDRIAGQIAALQDRINESEKFPDEVAAYELEIQLLEQQLAYYLKIPGADPTRRDSYHTVDTLKIFGENIRAASGDIFIRTGKITTKGGGNKLTAHADPSIVITNRSDSFLDIVDSSLSIPNPLDGGGRIMLNGNIVASGEGKDGLLYGLDPSSYTLDSLGTDSSATALIRIENTYTGAGGTDLSSELTLDDVQISNPGGLVEMLSKGSIWLSNGSNISSRDIAITTGGSFFQSYQDGRVDTGGDPLAGGTNIATAILAWINKKMFLGETVSFDTASLESDLAALKIEFQTLTGHVYSDATANSRITYYENLITAAQSAVDAAISNMKTYATEASYNASVTIMSGEDGSGTKVDTSKLVAKADAENTTTNKDGLAAAIKSYTEKTGEQETNANTIAEIITLRDQVAATNAQINAVKEGVLGADDITRTLAAYNEAVTKLQNAVTTDSWNGVFGAGGNGNTANLQPKSEGGSLTSLIAEYDSKKSDLEKNLSTAASAYVASKVKKYSDARTKTGGSDDVLTGHYPKSLVSSGSSGIERISDDLPDNSGVIYGKRSVYISAETLNINGTIQSGILEYDIDLNRQAVTDAIRDGKTDLTPYVFGTDGEQLLTLPKITFENGQIVLEDIEAMGGDITLFGNIISTGNGKLVVADGYGDITIKANENYGLALGRIDTGLGTEGTIRIVDTSQGTGGKPQTTVYTRENGTYYRTIDGVKNEINSDQLAYNPTADRWLQTVTGIESTLQWKYTYDKDVGYFLWIPGDWMAKDSSWLTGVSGSASIDKASPTGTFLVENKNLGDGILYGSYVRKAGDPKETYKTRKRDDRKAGTGHVHNYYDYTTTQKFTETFTTYLNASQPIAIQFTGDENTGSVSITGTKDITLGNLVRSVGSASITSTTGNIELAANAKDDTRIIAADLNLSAKNLGTSENALKLESVHAGSVVNLNAPGGVIEVDSKGSRLYVNSAIGDTVKITSTGDVLMKTGGGGIKADKDITVLVEAGRIIGEDGGYFKMQAGGNVFLSASSDISIEHTGDLHVDQILSSGGNLDIKVAGNILDKNIYEVPDPMSDAEQAAFWNSLGLIGGTDSYEARIASNLESYEREFTLLYFQAWREAGFSQENHDPDYQFQYTEAQRTIFLDSGLSEAEIRAEEQKRTDFYHQAMQNDFNAGYRYVASAREKQDLSNLTAWKKEELENAFVIPLFFLSQDAGVRNNTTSIIEAPNFSGQNITITASGMIGSKDNDIVIPDKVKADELKNNDSWRRAIADAEWDDVAFDTPSGFVTIGRYDDINIEARGILNVQTQNGGIYLGSQGDVSVDQITSGTDGKESLRFKIDGSITPHDSSSRITAKNAILEAAGGTLGTSKDSPLRINLAGTGADSWITARGTEGVYLSLIDSNGNSAVANLREIGSQKTVYLEAESFTDALSEVGAAKIGGRDIVLVATGGSIGTPDKPLGISQRSGGSLSLNAQKGIYVYGTTSLNLLEIIAGGPAWIESALDMNLTGMINVKGLSNGIGLSLIAGGNLTLDGSISVDEGSTELRAVIDIVLKGITSVSGDSTSLLAGNDIKLGGLIQSQGTGLITLIASKGAITDENDTDIAELNIDAADCDLIMKAALGIGSSNALELKVRSLDLVSQDGNINIDNRGDVVIKNVLAQGGGIDVYVGGAVRVDGRIESSSGNDILLVSRDDAVLGAGSSFVSGGTLAIVSALGDVLGEAANDSGAVKLSAESKIFLVSQSGVVAGSSPDGPLITEISAPEINVIGMEGIDLRNTSATDMNFGLIATQKSAKIETANKVKITIGHLVASTFESPNMSLKKFGDHVDVDLSLFLSSVYNPSSQGVLENILNVQASGPLKIHNKEEGGTTYMEEIEISPGQNLEFFVDNLIIDQITAGERSSLSHVGNDGGLADSTVIGNIISDEDFVFEMLHSDLVSIFAADLGGSVSILDGLVGTGAGNSGHLEIDLRGFRTTLDGIDKTLEAPADHWIWTPDGSYSFFMTPEGMDYLGNSSMISLWRAGTHFSINGNFGFNDSALNHLIAHWNHRKHNNNEFDRNSPFGPNFRRNVGEEEDKEVLQITPPYMDDSTDPNDFSIVPISYRGPLPVSGGTL